MTILCPLTFQIGLYFKKSKNGIEYVTRCITNLVSNARLPSLQPLSKHSSNCSPCFEGHRSGVLAQNFQFVLAPRMDSHCRKQVAPFALTYFCIPGSSLAHSGTSPK